TAPPAPTLLVTAPASVMRGQLFQFELALSRTASIAIDWNGDGVLENLVTVGGIIRVSHVYFEPGVRTIAIRASDDFGQMAQVLQQLLVTDNAFQPSAPSVSLPASNSDQTRFSEAARILGPSGKQDFAGFSQLTEELTEHSKTEVQRSRSAAAGKYRESLGTRETRWTYPVTVAHLPIGSDRLGQDRSDLEYHPQRSVEAEVPTNLDDSHHRMSRYTTATRSAQQFETVPSNVLERMNAMVDADSTEPSSWWRSLAYQIEGIDWKSSLMTYLIHGPDELNVWQDAQGTQYPVKVEGVTAEENEDVDAGESTAQDSQEKEAELLLEP
ncbi:MAG: hypothetical protein O2931_17845, partial [Planctomycetota bacterium]|nr:hypothetical protein [Planctomycetota bacterium]